MKSGNGGAAKHYYSANTEAEFDTEEWSKLTQSEREAISPVVWHRLIAQAEGSMQQNLFDARADRWLAWGPLDLDEHGWLEMTDRFEEMYRDIERMKHAAAARMKESGEVPLRVSYALLQFESPKREAKARRKPSESS